MLKLALMRANDRAFHVLMVAALSRPELKNKLLTTSCITIAAAHLLTGSAALGQTTPSLPTTIGEAEVIVVTAQRGRARGNPTPIRTLRRPQLEAARDLSIDEVVARLGRSGQNSPKVLVNGKSATTTIRVGGLTSQAIERIEILPPATASAYGEPVGGNVINIVLKRQFKSLQLAVNGVKADTAPRPDGRINAQRVVLNDDKIDNLSANIGGEAARRANATGRDNQGGTISPASTSGTLQLQLQRAFLEGGNANFSASIGGTKTTLTPARSALGPAGATVSDQRNWSVESGLGYSSGVYSVSANASVNGSKTNQRSPFDSTDSQALSSNISLSGFGPLLELPAGPIQANVAAGWQANNTQTTQQSTGLVNKNKNSTSQVNINNSFQIPIIAANDAGTAGLGASFGVNFARGAGQWGRDISTSLSWNPKPNLTMSLSHTDNKTPVTREPLTRPLVSTELVYDIVTGTSKPALVLRDNGPSANLSTAQQTEFNLSYSAQTRWPISVSASYSSARDQGRFDRPLDPSVELQIRQPSRYVRDDQGNLQSVDLGTRQLAPRARNNIRAQTDLRIPLKKSGAAKSGEEGNELAASDSELVLSLGSTWLLKDNSVAIDDRLGEIANLISLRTEIIRGLTSFSFSADRTSKMLSRGSNGQLVSLPSTIYGTIEFAAPLSLLAKDAKYLENTQARLGVSNISFNAGGANSDDARAFSKAMANQRPVTISLSLTRTF